MALPQINRLPLRFERDRLNKEGSPRHSPFLTIVKAPLPTGITGPRFAVLISKKINPNAVDRNRLKRQILSIIQEIKDLIPPADYMIIPKKTAESLSFLKLTSDIKSLLS